MRQFNRWGKRMGVVLLSAAMLAMCACGGGGKENSGNNDSGNGGGNGGASDAVTKYTVAFETNGGSTVASQTVPEGEKAKKPDDPSKADYIFEGWYKDSAYASAYDFEAETVSSNLTLYANWVDASNSTTATFYWNYEGKDVYESKAFADGNRISIPEDPVREGYYFAGWYTEKECTTAFSAMKKYSGAQSFYAKWMYIYKFEAENTQLTGLDYESDETGTIDELGNKKGQGYSSNVAGKNLIVQSGQASGNAYVSNLYINGSYLEFEVKSDAAVSDAKLYLVLSCEFTDMDLSPDMFRVEVNGEAVSYKTISLKGASLDNDLASGTRREFTTHYISDISLKQGTNSIKLVVDNDTHPFATGTVNALAPMVDCINVYSTSVLEMVVYSN